jgi:leader peptidase (prepilin peptidase)/N-methyltransferase
MANAFAGIVAGVFGLMFGSFLNVCIMRLPADESLLRPRSKCPKCGHMVGWRDNIPVLSWILLHGKCRHCGEAISWQYPLVEILVGVIWAAAGWYYGLTVTALSGALLGTMLLGIGITDARHYIIPDEYTWGGLVIGLLVSLTGGWSGLLTALVGAATGFGILLFVAWAGKKRVSCSPFSAAPSWAR